LHGVVPAATSLPWASRIFHLPAPSQVALTEAETVAPGCTVPLGRDQVTTQAGADEVVDVVVVVTVVLVIAVVVVVEPAVVVPVLVEVVVSVLSVEVVVVVPVDDRVVVL
jgi:hypothetical protein